MKLYSRLLMLFVDIYAKNVKFGYLNPILGKLGVTHDLGWWLIVKPMVDFLFALIELSSLSVTVPELDAKCVRLGCFRRGSTSLHSNLPRQCRPPISISRLETLGYATVKTAPFCVPSFWHNTGVWQIDRGRTDGFAVAYIALAKL